MAGDTINSIIIGRCRHSLDRNFVISEFQTVLGFLECDDCINIPKQNGFVHWNLFTKKKIKIFDLQAEMFEMNESLFFYLEMARLISCLWLSSPSQPQDKSLDFWTTFDINKPISTSITVVKSQRTKRNFFVFKERIYSSSTFPIKLFNFCQYFPLNLWAFNWILCKFHKLDWIRS